MNSENFAVNFFIVIAIAIAGSSCTSLDIPEGDELETLSSAVVTCPGTETTFGIDVSRYQGDINWTMLADADVKFAYIQISRRIDDIDPKFEENWSEAKAAGILRGAYQRFQPEQDVLTQANIFLDKLGPFQRGDLPPMLDVEDSGNLSAEMIAARVREWLVYVESALGVRPIIYTGRFFWRDTLNSADFTEYPLWIAHYTQECPNIPAPWSQWSFHQYSSSAVLPGITENTVDVNTFNGTIDDLLALSCGDSCQPCARIETETILDESGECFVAGGSPEFFRRENEGYDMSLLWTHTTDADTVGNFGQWTLDFSQEGNYLVEAHILSPWGMSESASYLVRHAGQATAVALNQSAANGWSSLGEFTFASGGDQSIRLDDNTGEANEGNTKLVFDAMRFTLLPPLPEPEPEPENKDTGCQIADGSAATWWIGLLVFLFYIRRRRHSTLGI
ncbi:MAG: hypothetical protein JKY56_07545 [Kofleriaceae bacterium]|nr:hypothetical protein [Kofleriaceae bacterium]